jgi:DNA-binding MarR family transcriptional regulator
MSDFLTMPGYLIRRAHQAATARFSEEMSQAGLTLTPFQYAALSAIASEPGLDQARVAQLADCDRATMGGILDRLVDRGLVARAVSDRDRRARVLKLTESGAALLDRARPVADHVQQGLTEGFSPQERANLTELLRRIADSRS